MKVLVTGGTGSVGSKVVTELLKRNAEVRLLVRKPKTDRMPAGVETVEGDLLDPIAVEKALEGVDKAYLLNAVVPDELTQALIVFGLARRRKLGHLVYHSVFKVEQFRDVPHFASKLSLENALRQFELPWTVMRPNYFFQNDLSLKEPLTKSGIYPMPLGEVGVSAVDTRDIAEAAAIVLTTEGHLGKTYNIVGPELMSGPAAASIWSSLLGREIRYGGDEMDAFEKEMRKQSPSWAAFDIRMMFEAYLERGFAADEGDVAAITQLLGHAPRRYRDFAAEAAAAWRGSGEREAKPEGRSRAASRGAYAGR